jgi:hypothetical protein
VERRTLGEQLAESCSAIEVHPGLQSASREGGQFRDAGGRGVQSLSLPSKEQGDRVLESCAYRSIAGARLWVTIGSTDSPANPNEAIGHISPLDIYYLGGLT